MSLDKEEETGSVNLNQLTYLRVCLYTVYLLKSKSVWYLFDNITVQNMMMNQYGWYGLNYLLLNTRTNGEFEADNDIYI